MNAGKRQAILAGVLAAVLAGVLAWACDRCAWCRRQAQDAAEDVRRCREMAGRIADLRTRPNLAGAEELQLAELARQVEQAARAARLAPDAVVRIWPEQARRAGDTVYKEKATQIVLRDVSAEQAARFLHALSAGVPGLWTSSLRLSAPRGRETGDTWTVEAVVSYLIYAPPEAGKELL